MAEWSKARDSKSRNPQKGFEGSNPSLSAIRLGLRASLMVLAPRRSGHGFTESNDPERSAAARSRRAPIFFFPVAASGRNPVCLVVKKRSRAAPLYFFSTVYPFHFFIICAAHAPHMPHMEQTWA